jgi:Flp pilus assembly protein TadG
MNMKSKYPIFLRLRRAAAAMRADCRGIAATEFAVIVPVMLLMFFGTVEISSGVAVKRKVTLVARTLSDLTSQTAASVDDSNMRNFFAASSAVLSPYSVVPVKPTISEIYINAGKVAKIQWSVSATIAILDGGPQATLKASAHKKGDTITTVPTELLVPDTYLIWSEVDYTYVPTIGYFMSKDGVPLEDKAFTRPRQSKCVDYPKAAIPCTPAAAPS